MGLKLSTATEFLGEDCSGVSMIEVDTNIYVITYVLASTSKGYVLGCKYENKVASFGTPVLLYNDVLAARIGWHSSIEKVDTLKFAIAYEYNQSGTRYGHLVCGTVDSSKVITMDYANLKQYSTVNIDHYPKIARTNTNEFVIIDKGITNSAYVEVKGFTVSGTTPSLGSASSVKTSGASDYNQIKAISTSKAVVFYYNAAGDLRSVVVNTSGNTATVHGTSYQVSTLATGIPEMVFKLTDTTVLVLYSSYTDSSIYFKILSVSGNVITPNGETTTSAKYIRGLSEISSGKYILLHAGDAPNYYLKYAECTVSGTDFNVNTYNNKLLDKQFLTNANYTYNTFLKVQDNLMVLAGKNVTDTKAEIYTIEKTVGAASLLLNLN